MPLRLNHAFCDCVLKARTPILLAALFSLQPFARAQTYTWTDGSFDTKWTSGGNWVGGLSPLNGGDLLFTGVKSVADNGNFYFPTNDINGGVFNTLTFGPGSGSFSVMGNAFTLLNGLRRPGRILRRLQITSRCRTVRHGTSKPATLSRRRAILPEWVSC